MQNRRESVCVPVWSIWWAHLTRKWKKKPFQGGCLSLNISLALWKLSTAGHELLVTLYISIYGWDPVAFPMLSHIKQCHINLLLKGCCSYCLYVQSVVYSTSPLVVHVENTICVHAYASTHNTANHWFIYVTSNLRSWTVLVFRAIGGGAGTLSLITFKVDPASRLTLTNRALR